MATEANEEYPLYSHVAIVATDLLHQPSTHVVYVIEVQETMNAGGKVTESQRQQGVPLAKRNSEKRLIVRRYSEFDALRKGVCFILQPLPTPPLLSLHLPITSALP